MTTQTCGAGDRERGRRRDRKSTRLNSSHQIISYAVFCLKKKIPLTITSQIEIARTSNGTATIVANLRSPPSPDPVIIASHSPPVPRSAHHPNVPHHVVSS